jgi:hypothetical protein
MASPHFPNDSRVMKRTIVPDILDEKRSRTAAVLHRSLRAPLKAELEAFAAEESANHWMRVSWLIREADDRG